MLTVVFDDGTSWELPAQHVAARFSEDGIEELKVTEWGLEVPQKVELPSGRVVRELHMSAQQREAKTGVMWRIPGGGTDRSGTPA